MRFCASTEANAASASDTSAAFDRTFVIVIECSPISSAARSDDARVSTVADTDASASVVMLFDALFAMVTTSPAAKPSVTHEPLTRVIVSPVAPTSAKMTPFDATTEQSPAATTSAAKSVVFIVSTVALTPTTVPETLLSVVPAKVT